MPKKLSGPEMNFAVKPRGFICLSIYVPLTGINRCQYCFSSRHPALHCEMTFMSQLAMASQYRPAVKTDLAPDSNNGIDSGRYL
jgi:hypothetical protein